MKQRTKPTSTPLPAAEPVKIETPPETDILRTDTYKLSPDKETALRLRLTDRIKERLRSLTSALELQEVAQFLEVMERNRGCTTPAETFIIGLLGSHFREEGLDLSDIEWHLREFKTSSEGIEDLLGYFGEMYPELIRKVLASTRAAAPVS